jgi:hypothetical protein
MVVRGGKPQMVEAEAFESEAILQGYLETFPSLIPLEGVQEHPAPLLVIGREVSVPPGSIDLLLIDTEGVLTIVETKMARNPESRRQVMGQILEYASYISRWGAADIERQAHDYLRSEPAPEELRGLSLYEALGKLVGDEETPHDDIVSMDELRVKVEENLGKGRMRLIVAVDEVVEPLRATITFLNTFSAFEVLLLQVSQFRTDPSTRIFVPSVFGYSGRVLPPPVRQKWDEDRFIEHLEASNDAETVAYSVTIYQRLKEWTDHHLWGSGTTYGSFNLIILVGATRVNVASITSRGDLYVNFAWMKSKVPEEGVRSLAEELGNIDGLTLPADVTNKCPSLPKGVLKDPVRLEQVMDAIHKAVSVMRALP